jgi:single-strand DNA-binding protein
MSSPITVVGNLGTDPELKFTNTGLATVRLRIGSTKKGYNDKPDVTSWFTASAIGDIASNIANTLHKGNRVVVYGNMVQRTWDKPDGTKGEVTEISIEAIGPDLRFNTAVIEGHISKQAQTVKPVFDTEDAF